MDSMNKILVAVSRPGGVFGKAKKDSVTEEDCITQSKAIFQGGAFLAVLKHR